MQKRARDNFLGKYLLIISCAAGRVDWWQFKTKIRVNSQTANRRTVSACNEEGGGDWGRKRAREKGRKRGRGWRDTDADGKALLCRTHRSCCGRTFNINRRSTRHAFPSVNTPVYPPQIVEFSIKRRPAERIVNAQQPFHLTVKQNYHRPMLMLN